MTTTVDVVPAASATILRIHGEITGGSEPALMDLSLIHISEPTRH